MLLDRIKKYHLILASQSPRRQVLLKELGFNFEIIVKNTDESFPNYLKNSEIVEYLALKKSEAFNLEVQHENTIVITADTIVVCNAEVMNKPLNKEEAFVMLSKLSGNSHDVFTGVCFKTESKIHTFHAHTKVYFNTLSSEEINYYIDNYQPYDKAGSYGIQEWIGFVAIQKMEGSFHNVMGLPIAKLYQELNLFIQ